MFAVATISESYLYLYLHDLCVFLCVCVLCIFYVYMGQVPAIKLMIDYRRVNAVTIKDAFPVPDVKDALDSLS